MALQLLDRGGGEPGGLGEGEGSKGHPEGSAQPPFTNSPEATQYF